MDIHGSLESLSIREQRAHGEVNELFIGDQTQQYHTALDAQHSNGSDMEVDSEEELDSQDESIQTIHQNAYETSTPIKETEVEVEPENSSFVSALSLTLFSPTNIGAQYAMKTAGSQLQDSQQQQDSKDIKTVATRHINSFSSNSDNSIFLNEREPEFVYNTEKQDYEEFNNSMSQSYFYRKYNMDSPSPMKREPYQKRPMISASTGDGTDGSFFSRDGSFFSRDDTNVSRFSNTSNLSRFNSAADNTPTSIQVHHHHYYISPNKSNHDVDDTSYMSVNSVTSGILNSSHHGLEQVALPPPWKQESIPKLKYAYIISTYLQLILNFAVSFYGVYIIYNIIRTIRRDIEVKLMEQTSNLMVEIESCRRQYYDNNCSPDLIVPALEKPCRYWAKCMNQPLSPNLVGNRSSISAETLGLVINSLIEPLGLKFFMLVFTGSLAVFGFNFMFGFIRAKSYYGERDQVQKNQ